jgi:hypothetical protein
LQTVPVEEAWALAIHLKWIILPRKRKSTIAGAANGADLPVLKDLLIRLACRSS